MNASLPGRDRLQRRRSVHDERIPAHAGEHTNAVPGATLLVVYPEGDRVARRRRADALLLDAVAVAVGGIGKDAVEHELVLARR